MRLLLERDANVLATDSDGATPLHLAASRGHAEAVCPLVQTFAAPVDAADQYGETPLHWAADHGQAPRSSSPASPSPHPGPNLNPNLNSNTDSSPDQAAAVRLLLSLGARVEAAVTKGPLAGWTALHWAAARDHTPTARVLLELGASADATDQQQQR